MRRPAKVDPAVPCHVAGQRKVWEPANETLENDGGLEPCQGCAKAVMRSRAERHVLARVLPRQLELVCVGAPETFVPVGGAETRHDERAGWDHDVPHLDRF